MRDEHYRDTNNRAGRRLSGECERRFEACSASVGEKIAPGEPERKASRGKRFNISEEWAENWSWKDTGEASRLVKVSVVES